MFVSLFAIPSSVEFLLILAYLFLVIYTIRRSYKKFDKGRLSLFGLILLILLTIAVPLLGPVLANVVLIN